VNRVRFGTQVCGSLAEGGRREWLVPDGRGGYAMGTVSGLRTRRYHGLLVVAGETAGHRMLALAALDPVLVLGSGTAVRLATHEWADGTVAPAGYQHLASFELQDGLPCWRWRVGEVVLERRLAIRHASAGHPVLAVVDRLLAGSAALRVDALCTWRDAHGERYADQGLPVENTADGVLVAGAYQVCGPGFAPAGQWWRGAYAREEAARGLNPTEDLFHAGSFTAEPGAPLVVTAWAGTGRPAGGDIIAQARQRARATVAAARPAGEAEALLALAVDAFVVSGPAGPDVVAGYPWFGAWSRDTMISYEGLFLATGRASAGRDLLRAYVSTLDRGMLANTADTGRVEHNTADATLWLLHALDRHITSTGDDDLAAEVLEPLGSVVEHHLAGTRYGIRVDPASGLLSQGAAGYALTWMDAVVAGEPVTPRPGAAVELNALWLNGLAALVALHTRLGRPADHLRRLLSVGTAAFQRRFPAGTGWLFDTVDPPDAACRPNQLLAFSLPYAPMPPDPAVIRTLAAHLLTPLGLRTLAPGEPGYRGQHRGPPDERDRAYHQGTVWPWLIGPYADAGRAAGLDLGGLLDGLLAHLGEWGLGSVSETAEGDAPHTATGCPFQAWSVAELLRTLRRRG
jgi:predicted glycogen debranching enzyme